MISLLHKRDDDDNVPQDQQEQQQAVAMKISSDDFPGDEKIAKEIISVLSEVYCDDAKMACMAFSRGSVLMQDAKFFTPDLLTGVLNNAFSRK